MKLPRSGVVVVVLGLMLAGCSAMGAATPVETGGRMLPDGSWYLYDTPSHWAEFQRMMDMHIDTERSGAVPTGMKGRSWDAFWKARIVALSPSRQENGDMYVAYIVEARRRAGLPELSTSP